MQYQNLQMLLPLNRKNFFEKFLFFVGKFWQVFFSEKHHHTILQLKSNVKNTKTDS